MSKILVTGSDGFIGSHLVEELVKKGYSVKAFVLYNSFNSWGWLDTLPKEVMQNVEVFAGDIRDPHGVKEAMKGCSAVFHLAALIAIPFSYHSPDTYVDTNITDSKNTRVSQSSGNQSAYNAAVATNRIDISNIPKPCYLDMTGIAWAANSAAVHNRIVYSIDLMCGIRSNGYTGTNGSTNADYNDGINITNIERHNDTNTDITIKITDPGIDTIAFSGYTGTDTAADGFTGHGNMNDANIQIWYKDNEAKLYDFTGNLLDKLDVKLNQRWSASAKTYTTENGMAAIQIPMSVVLGKQIKITGFSVTQAAGGGSRGSIANIVTSSDYTAVTKIDPLNSICTDNGDGSYTFTVPNNTDTTAHQIIVLSLVGNTTGAMSASELANCRIEIL